MRVKVFSQGEGAVNTVGGLRPNTVTPNITGDIKSFWRYEYIYIFDMHHSIGLTFLTTPRY